MDLNFSELQQQEHGQSLLAAEEVLIPNEGARINMKLILLSLSNPCCSDEAPSSTLWVRNTEWKTFVKVTAVPIFSAFLG